MTTLLIPDLSEWQGTAVSWPRLIAAGYPAAIIRVHNGTRADNTYRTNRQQAHAHGIHALGLYAYLTPARPAVDQAREFVALVGQLRPGEWPICDYEAAHLTADDAKAWFAYVGEHLHGAEPWLYAGEYVYRDAHLGEATAVPARRTWLAAYGPDEPTEPHELWQYTDHRVVPGVGSPVDCSAFRGDLADLLAAVGMPPAHPAPGPTVHPSHPYPVGIHPGGSTPSARPLQRALKVTGWMVSSIDESDHYGQYTERAVAGFNAKHGFNSKGLTYDPAIGPHGWALLMTLAYGRN